MPRPGHLKHWGGTVGCIEQQWKADLHTFTITEKYSCPLCIWSGFEQPAKHVSNRNNHHTMETPLHSKKLLFLRIYFLSSIMELRKCSLQGPYRDVLQQKPNCLFWGWGSTGDSATQEHYAGEALELNFNVLFLALDCGSVDNHCQSLVTLNRTFSGG